MKGQPVDQRPAITLTPADYSRPIQIVGEKTIYQLVKHQPRTSFIELHLTRGSQRFTRAIAPNALIEVMP